MDTFKKILDNPIAKRALIGLGVFVLAIIIVMLVVSCSGGKSYTFEELESKMVTLAKDYYKINKTNLPKNDNDEVKLSLQTLINDGKIKSTEDITKTKSSCQGNIKVINHNGYYLYIPELNCGKDYKSQTLLEVLTDEQKIVTSGNGLYKNNTSYVYKGDTLNNYLSFNKNIYRIIGINEDGTIRLIDTTRRDNTPWDNRYNIEKNNNSGINDYIINNINSRVKDAVESIYNDNEKYPEELKSLFKTTSVCTGKRSVQDTSKDGSTECTTRLDKQVFSLLQANEYYLASLDTNCNEKSIEACRNYNYLTSIGTTWTITADKDTTFKAFKVTSDGLTLSGASNSSPIKIVANLDSNVLFASGEGTETNPYIIKTFIVKK